MATINKTVKARIFVVMIGFIVCVLVVIGRLAYLQFAIGPWLKSEAVKQQMRDDLVGARRGTIYDRNNKPLAESGSAKTVVISPKTISETKEPATTGELIATTLAQKLEVKYEDVKQKIGKTNSGSEIIKKKIPKELADEIIALELPGVACVDDTKRIYPYSNFASHVLGFTGDDNQGLEGIERVLDATLKGTKGRVRAAKNARGQLMPYQHEIYEEPNDGDDVILTIDEVIQHYAEKHLETAVIENKVAKGGACIVMDPNNGDILAMAVKPDYDLTQPYLLNNPELQKQVDMASGEERTALRSELLAKMWRNKAVVDTYEPGSTFKIITSSIALEENLVKLTDQFNCPGFRVVANARIGCHKTIGHGMQTFVQGVQNSCNPVFMDVGQRIGAQTFMKYIEAFGFKQKTEFELPGEASGIFHNMRDFNEVELATYSFGQGFQITPLQVVSAISSVANGGELIRPHIVNQIVGKDGVIKSTGERTTVRKVISKQTSDTMRNILESVVSEGAGGNAYLPGYRVAGKTGTSEKRPRGSNTYIASFVGFAPADNPRLLCLVLLDEPNGEYYYGGIIAAPVVRDIMEDSLRYLGVEQQLTEEERSLAALVMPDVKNLEVSNAKAEIGKLGLKCQVFGSGNVIIAQTPHPGVQLREDAIVYLYTEGSTVTQVTVPNLSNRTALQANQVLINEGLNFRTTQAVRGGGATFVVRQDPPAGTKVDMGTVVTVEFRHLEVD